MRVGVRLTHTSVDIIMDESPSQETLEHVSEIVSKVAGVLKVRDIKIHQRGPNRNVDLEIQVLGHIAVSEGHRIASNVRDVLMQSNLRITDAMVHVEPFGED